MSIHQSHQTGNRISSPPAPQDNFSAAVRVGGRDAIHSDRIASVLRKVGDLLEGGRPQDAFDLIKGHSPTDPFIKNARGVCLMRMQEPALAVRVYRELALAGDRISLRKEIPVTMHVNFATALLMSNNIAGCQELLDEINDDANSQIIRLRAAIDGWKSQLTPWQRLMWLCGVQPRRPVTLDFTPGELL